MGHDFLFQVSNDTDLEERVAILEVEVSFLTDDVEEIETDVNQLNDEMIFVQETVIENTNDIAGKYSRFS